MKVAAAAGLLAAVGAAQQHGATTCAAAGGGRKVRFWVGLNGAGGVGIVDRATNASCSEAFLRNLSRYKNSIDSIGIESWKWAATLPAP